ncbi:hypothetical protein EZI54_23865 [Marinobacter halodurans]|uniref:Uncharacterized protein n=1 Tax=Marinobacter halodurans TaxID=2528979 RepID=A0ABY1ZH55_9GAMM|nr:hypothetical protein EZI54_23865 [Marinobacter halodurans]
MNDALYCLRFLLMILLLVEMMNQSSGTCPNFGVHFIARQLHKASGGQGSILDLTVPDGNIRVKEFGKLEDFVDHRVFSDGENIIDPRFSPNPIPVNQYLDELRQLNPSLVVKDVTP